MSEDQIPPGFVSEDEEIIEDFIIEAGEFLEQLDQDLITLEQEPENLELLDQIFRAAHTIKGNASFLGFGKLTRFTHQTENVLDKLRAGDMPVTPEVMDVVLASVDKMKELMANLRDESVVEIEALLKDLEECLKVKSLASEPPIPAPSFIEPDDDDDDDMAEIIDDFYIEASEFMEQLDQDLITLEQEPDNLDLLNQIFRPVHTIKGNASFLGFDVLTRFTHQLENVLDQLRNGDRQATPDIIDLVLDGADVMKALVKNLKDESAVDTAPMMQRLHECLTGQSAPIEDEVARSVPQPIPSPSSIAVAPAEVPAAVVPSPPPPKTIKKKPNKKSSKKASSEEQTIRVDVERLDNLMNLAGELVIAKNRLQQFTSQFDELFSETNAELVESLMVTTSLVSFITGQFQEAVMTTRMLPIKKVFSRVPRMIRDLSRDTGKKVKLIMTGEETELDKSVIEYIGDPLVHIIRNAVDHGLESPEERAKTDKDPEGKVYLSAYSEGNYIVIEIKDDGKGMDPHRILKKAIEKGLVSADDTEHLSEREMLDYIFAPGFSTADSVSNISGRGVGMNVVKENIMKLDGLVEIQSKVGLGSTFRIQLPLTMAIAPALLVQVNSSTYAIPLGNVVETLVIEPEQIYQIDRKQVIHLRDKVVSLVHLSDILEEPRMDRKKTKSYVIIVGAGEQRVGFLVEKLMGQEEVVIKSLGEFFEDVSVIAGATIMGDGSVVLILDIGTILQNLSRKPLSIA